MKEDALIKKWLDNQLSEDELKEFQQLEGYDSYIKISETAQFFKAPNYDGSKAYHELQSLLERKKSGMRFLHIARPIATIAAIFVVGIAIYSLFFMNKITTVDTLSGQISKVVLPDASTAR